MYKFALYIYIYTEHLTSIVYDKYPHNSCLIFVYMCVHLGVCEKDSCVSELFLFPKYKSSFRQNVMCTTYERILVRVRHDYEIK